MNTTPAPAPAPENRTGHTDTDHAERELARDPHGERDDLQRDAFLDRCARRDRHDGITR